MLSNFDGAYDLFLRVLVRREQVDGLDVAEVDVVAEQEDEEELAHVLLLLVSVERLVALELAPDVGELLVDPLDLGLLALAVADVGDEDGQAAHRVSAHRRHHGEGRGYLGRKRSALGLCGKNISQVM